jgi:uncharacterized protein (DUF302 family)
MNPFFQLDTKRPFEEACDALEVAVPAHGFGLLAMHDLAATLRSKGIEFPEQCRVFEVCNPQQTAQVLAADMALNMALPCRISVYTQVGTTCIGMIRPEAMLNALSSNPALADVARQVEDSTVAIIKAAAEA